MECFASGLYLAGIPMHSRDRLQENQGSVVDPGGCLQIVSTEQKYRMCFIKVPYTLLSLQGAVVIL